MGWGLAKTVYELLTTKGDLAVHDGTSTTRLPVGVDGQALVADSTATEGVAWSSSVGQRIIEAGDVQTDGSVDYRWGIDQYDRPYFDSTGAVVNSEAAYLYIDPADSRFKAATLGLD